MSVYSVAVLECHVIAEYCVLATVWLLYEVGAWIHVRTIVECFHQTFIVIVTEYFLYMYGLHEFNGKRCLVGSVCCVTGCDCPADVIHAFAQYARSYTTLFTTE
jgi:hypothetical protein